MVNVERLGVLLNPPKGDDKAQFAFGRRGEYAVYNAGMVLVGDVVHMLYRQSRNYKAEGWQEYMGAYCEDFIGHATLTPKGKLIKDYGKVIEGDNDWDLSGVQDPRIVFFEGRYYIFYCAYNIGVSSKTNPQKARMGFAVTDDFITYKKLGIVDLPEWDKDHFIFPERIGGKVCLMHRIEPDIYMDFFDSIDDMVNQQSWAKYHMGENQAIRIQREFEWESLKIGGSVPPIKTKDGWLFIYHGVSWKDGVKGVLNYCAGVALLDLADPTKVIARLKEPFIYPKENYEVYGDVNNVVFPVGAYVYGGELYISYGGADKVVAMAKTNLNDLLADLKKTC